MRIIAGKYKSRQLEAPKGQQTRPTTDKNKEALFSQIGPYFNGGHCLDLFGGSGGLGLEALSRGMETLVICEKHPLSIKTIYRNIKSLGVESVCEVHRMDGLIYLKSIASNPFDLILLDPPYQLGLAQKAILLIEAQQLLKAGGLLVVETLKTELIECKYPLIKERIQGDTRVQVYRGESIEII